MNNLVSLRTRKHGDGITITSPLNSTQKGGHYLLIVADSWELATRSLGICTRQTRGRYSQRSKPFTSHRNGEKQWLGPTWVHLRLELAHAFTGQDLQNAGCARRQDTDGNQRIVAIKQLNYISPRLVRRPSQSFNSKNDLKSSAARSWGVHMYGSRIWRAGVEIMEIAAIAWLIMAKGLLRQKKVCEIWVEIEYFPSTILSRAYIFLWTAVWQHDASVSIIPSTYQPML